jgi:hypothetical protein
MRLARVGQASRPVRLLLRGLLAAALLLGISSAQAQTILGPRARANMARRLQPQEGEKALWCEVEPIRPALNFGFRFQAGYVVRVPMSQYSGSGHRWTLLSSISAVDGGHEPVYLAERVILPDIPKTKVVFEVGGGYLLGVGRYTMKWVMWDDQNRVCRKHWKIDVKLGLTEGRVKVAMPPGAVCQLSSCAYSAAQQVDGDVRPVRLTVLLHAAPLLPRRPRLRVSDLVVLLGSLSSLLERLPARSVRLVVFNLDQQKEFFRRDSFTLDGLDQVAQSLSELQLGKVDYHVLQNRRGHLDLIADLVNRELQDDNPSDAIVFLGPSARFTDKLDQSTLKRPDSLVPRFFYFQYKPYPGGNADFSDSINSAMARLGGRTLVIHSPVEFARAIEQLQRQVLGGN